MNIAEYIEHTYLKPDCTQAIVKQLCEEALEHNLAGVCIPPVFVADAARWLEDSTVKVVTVVGFPMGYSATAAKVEEVKRAIDDGAQEVDMVINISAVKGQRWAIVRSDIDSVTRATHLKGRVVKVIVETALLTPEELNQVCAICTELEVDYIKTSTGFNGRGASVEDISNIRSASGANVKIKAAGGIRDRATAEALIEEGAHRLGTSSAQAILSVEKMDGIS